MDANYVASMANSKMKLVRNSYIISLVLVIVFVVMLILLLKSKKKGLMNNLIKILVMVFCTINFFMFFIEGVDAHIIVNKLIKDSQEMNSYSTSGSIEDFYTKAKTLFIIIDSDSYICKEVELNIDVMFGKEYKIVYLENSKLIIEMEQID